MICIVNGESRELQDGITIEALIKELGLADAICAAEVDKKIVPKRERSGYVLRAGQSVEIVTLVGGG